MMSILRRLFTSFGKSVATIFCLLLLAGCGTSVKNLEGSNDPNVVFFKLRKNTRPNMALVYVYRPFRFGAGAAAPMMFVRGQLPISLRNQHHTVLELPPGVYRIDTRHGENWIYGQEDSKTISVESGCRYYVRTQAETQIHPLHFLVDVVLGGPVFPVVETGFPIELIEEDSALPEIRETLFQNPEQEETPVPASWQGVAINCARNKS